MLGDYFSVGDVGYFDADGFLYISDRKIDMVVSGGVNIYPAQVASLLHLLYLLLLLLPLPLPLPIQSETISSFSL